MQILRIDRIIADHRHITIRMNGGSGGVCIENLGVEVREPYESAEEPNGHVWGVMPSVWYAKEEGCTYLSFDRFVQARDLLYRKIFVYVKTAGMLRRLSGPCYGVQDEDTAKWIYPFPHTHTKKGLQVKVLEDALKLGLGHAALNVNLPCIVQASDENDAIVFPFEGKRFFFNRSYMQMLDHQIKTLSDRNVVVNLIIINRAEWYGVGGDPVLTPLFIHPKFHPDGVVSAFHMTSFEALMYYRACLEFLAERYMRQDRRYGRACGWIIGNEVNAPWIYSNCGETGISEFAKEYQIALRSAFCAVRKYYAQARVYISLDHCWNLLLEPNDRRFYRGRELLETLHDHICRESDFDWGIAYHPFPENLARADFWNDKTAWKSFDTGKITFKNIEVLPAYLSQEKFRYAGKIRRIILSEQGLCSGRLPEEEQLQADAFVLAYRKIQGISEIDSFIYHSHIDEHNEGLFLGLLADDGRKKPIYHCFAKIDGPEEPSMFAQACARVGEQALKAIFDTNM